MNLFNELKRRNVFKVAAAYLIVSWLILQVIGSIVPIIEAPEWVSKTILMLLLAGFPIALLFAWAFELTPEGIKKESDVVRDESITTQTSSKLNLVIIGALVLIIGGFAYDKFIGASTTTGLVQDQAKSSENTAKEELNNKSSESNSTNDKSIAVLPFVNMSSDKNQEYFADGISEEILNALVKASGLRVAGRTSSFSFKGKNTTIKQIGNLLKVAYVLEGSVRKQNQQVRITAQLIKTDDGFHLWSETYDGTLDNVFDLQEDISRKVTSELKLILNLGSQQRLASKLTNNIDAYDLFLRGREKVRKRINNNIPEGIALLQQAVDLDPNFAQAWAKLAEAEAVSVGYTGVDGELANERAQKHISKALQLNNKLALPYAVKGLLSLDKGDYLASIDHYTNALNLEPNNSLAIRWQGDAYSTLGLNELALPLFEKAYALDPLSSIETHNLASLNFKLDNTEQAIRYFQITSDLRGYSLLILAYVYDYLGHTQKAIDHYQKSNKIRAEKYGTELFFTEDQAALFALGAFSGTKEQKKSAQSIYTSRADDRRYWQLSTLLLVDNIDRVFEILQSKPLFFGPFASDHMWLPLEGIKKFRADPRFIKLLVKHKLPIAWQKLGWPKYCQPNAETDGSNGQFKCQ